MFRCANMVPLPKKTRHKKANVEEQMEDERRCFAELIVLAARKRQLKKAVLSKPGDAGDVRAVLTLRHIGGRDCLQAECFRTDNKAMHENLPPEVSGELLGLLARFGQVNLLTAAGESELRCGKRGTLTVLGGEKLRKKLEAMPDSTAEVPENDRKKQYILQGDEPFLRLLDVSDANGRVKDKRQAKFRQINRFLELVRDCQQHLPKEGVLRICDLCCGKSYLSFAAYHYFANILGREVRMTGIDLKPDVIAYCGDVARQLGWTGWSSSAETSAGTARAAMWIWLFRCTPAMLQPISCWSGRSAGGQRSSFPRPAAITN